ncbi:MAG: DUF445 family protein, partial [Thermonemataceae bacterium]|nr:DUF445 family protein [Thermonemataceae bacterium]
SFIKDKVKDKADIFKKNALHSIFSDTDFQALSPWLNKQIKNYLEREDLTNNLQNNIFQLFEQKIKDKNLWDLLSSSQKEDIAHFILQESQKLSPKVWQNYAYQPLGYLIDFKRTQKLENLTADFLQKKLIDELENLLSGRIEAIVKRNLSSLPPERIRDMVENFMGKELAPINALGALLGALVGGALLTMPTMENPYIGTAINGLTYGVTGYATNWLALKMIFRPYQQKKLGKMPLPFTPGIITKNKKRFAQNMGKFVGEKLLQSDSIVQQFYSNKNTLGLQIFDFVSRDNYYFLQENILNQEVKIKHFLEKELDSYWAREQHNLHHFTEKKLREILYKNLASVDTQNIERRIADYLFSDKISHLIEQNIVNQVFAKQELKHLADILPESLWVKLPTTLHNFLYKETQKLFESHQQGKVLLKQLSSWAEKKYNELKEKPVREIIGNEKADKLLQNFVEWAYQQLLVYEDKILIGIRGRLEKEIAPDKKIAQLLGGKLLNFLQKNALSLIDGLLEKGIMWLENNKQNLAEEVYEKAYQENKAAFIYKKTIKETVLELATYGIPDFFKSQIPELQYIISEKIQKIGELRVGLLGTEINDNNLNEWLHNFLRKQAVRQSLQGVTEVFLEHSILAKQLRDFSDDNLLKINNLEQILSNEIKLFYRQLQEILSDKNHFIFTYLSDFFAKQLYIFATNYQQDWIHTDTKEILKKISNYIGQNAVFQEQIQKKLQETFYIFKQQKIQDFLSEENLLTFNKKLQTILLSSTFRNTLQKVFSDIFDSLVPNLLGSLAVETKEVITKEIIDTMLATLENNLAKILQSIDLKRVVVEEIEAMHPKEIEELFNSFAGMYFKQLINYGFGFGIIFGLGIDALFMGIKEVFLSK